MHGVAEVGTTEHVLTSMDGEIIYKIVNSSEETGSSQITREFCVKIEISIGYLVKRPKRPS